MCMKGKGEVGAGFPTLQAMAFSVPTKKSS